VTVVHGLYCDDGHQQVSTPPPASCSRTLYPEKLSPYESDMVCFHIPFTISHPSNAVVSFVGRSQGVKAAEELATTRSCAIAAVLPGTPGGQAIPLGTTLAVHGPTVLHVSSCVMLAVCVAYVGKAGGVGLEGMVYWDRKAVWSNRTPFVGRWGYERKTRRAIA